MPWCLRSSLAVRTIRRGGDSSPELIEAAELKREVDGLLLRLVDAYGPVSDTESVTADFDASDVEDALGLVRGKADADSGRPAGYERWSYIKIGINADAFPVSVELDDRPVVLYTGTMSDYSMQVSAYEYVSFSSVTQKGVMRSCFSLAGNPASYNGAHVIEERMDGSGPTFAGLLAELSVDGDTSTLCNQDVDAWEVAMQRTGKLPPDRRKALYLIDSYALPLFSVRALSGYSYTKETFTGCESTIGTLTGTFVSKNDQDTVQYRYSFSRAGDTGTYLLMKDGEYLRLYRNGKRVKNP